MVRFIPSIKLLSFSFVSLFAISNAYTYYVIDNDKSVLVTNTTKVNMIDDLEMQEGESLSHNQILQILNSKKKITDNESL